MAEIVSIKAPAQEQPSELVDELGLDWTDTELSDFRSILDPFADAYDLVGRLAAEDTPIPVSRSL